MFLLRAKKEIEQSFFHGPTKNLVFISVPLLLGGGWMRLMTSTSAADFFINSLWKYILYSHRWLHRDCPIKPPLMITASLCLSKESILMHQRQACKGTESTREGLVVIKEIRREGYWKLEKTWRWFVLDCLGPSRTVASAQVALKLIALGSSSASPLGS